MLLIFVCTGPVKRWTKGLLTKFLKAIGRSDTAPQVKHMSVNVQIIMISGTPLLEFQLGEINLECGTTVDESSSEGTEDNSKQELTAASPRRLPPKPQASRSKVCEYFNAGSMLIVHRCLCCCNYCFSLSTGKPSKQRQAGRMQNNSCI